ncbi:unnamed protein product [Prorocentrum cordatum]|uniref:Uncharacterized protein n=1 Tax=Prorocentrum cordatum TaxID=2364126 RepID=A0ABN9SZV9_9DINO|nr:unnamed protein product [Polarella glacialis]
MASVNQPARDLAIALSDVMGGAQGSDSKLQATIKRLHEAAGLDTGNGERLEDNPVIKKMKAELAEMQGHIKNHGDQLASIQQSTSTTSDDVRALRNLLEGGLGGNGGKGSWNAPGPKGLGKGADQGVPAVHENGPVVNPIMTKQMHETALSFLGVSKDRADVSQWAATIPEGGLPYLAWWTEIGKKKGLDQWRRKLKSLGASEAQVDGKDLAVMGTLLFQFLDEDGEWADTAMQQAPPAA